jgi:hypothetical protein
VKSYKHSTVRLALVEASILLNRQRYSNKAIKPCVFPAMTELVLGSATLLVSLQNRRHCVCVGPNPVVLLKSSTEQFHTTADKFSYSDVSKSQFSTVSYFVGETEHLGTLSYSGELRAPIQLDKIE